MENKFLQFLSIVKKSGNLTEGYNQTEELIKLRRVRLLIISKDASSNSFDKFSHYALKYGVKLIQEFNKEELGAYIGRAEINIIGITDEQMSKKLKELYNLLGNH